MKKIYTLDIVQIPESVGLSIMNIYSNRNEIYFEVDEKYECEITLDSATVRREHMLGNPMFSDPIFIEDFDLMAVVKRHIKFKVDNLRITKMIVDDLLY